MTTANLLRDAIDDGLIDRIATVCPDLGDVREQRTFVGHCNRGGRHHNVRIHVLDSGVVDSPIRFRVDVEDDHGGKVRGGEAATVDAALELLRWTDLDG